MTQQANDYRQSRTYKRRWWTLAVLSLSILIVVIDNTILNVALPTLQRELGATGAELQWIVDAYILAFAALLLTMGALGDRLGRAHLLKAGMLVFGAASLGAALAGSAEHLIAARVVMGIGAAMIMPATLAIITNVFPREERGKAIGMWGAMNGAGVALGPILGGVLIEHFDWSAIFLINIPIAVIAIVAGYFLVPNSSDPNPRRLDIVGTVVSTATLSVLVFGLIKGGDWGWGNPTVVGLLVGAVALGALFVLWERRTTSPMLPIPLFNNQRFSAGVASISSMGFIQFGIAFGFTLYMQFVQGYSALDTGIRFLPIALGVALGSGTSHRRVARFGTKWVVGVGFVGVALLAIVASFWQADTPYWQLGLVLFAFAFFMGNVIAPAVDSVLGAVPEARAGVGSAMNSVSVQVGGAIGIAALGSAISSVYASRIEPALAAIPNLPAEVVEAARDSVGAAMTIASKLPDALARPLAEAASNGFMDGWQVMGFVICGVALVGAALVFAFLPPRHLPVVETSDVPEAADPVKGGD